MNSIKYILCFVLICVSTAIYSQSDCENAIFDANNYYKKGQLDECINKLESCIKFLTTDKEKVEGYRLLALSNMGRNDSLVHLYIRKMLSYEPQYIEYSSGQDPRAFKRLLDQYTVSPKVTLGVILGPSLGSPILIENRNSLSNITSEYKSRMGFAFGLIGEYKIEEGMKMEASLNQFSTTISHEVVSSDFYYQSYKEAFSFVSLDIGASYFFKINPGFRLTGGYHVGLNFLTHGRYFVDVENTNTEEVNQFSSSDISRRNKFQFFGKLHIGLEKRYKLSEMGARVSLMNSFTPTVNNNATKSDFEFESLYSFDQIAIRSIAFELYYSVPISFDVKRNQ
jgi:hypothetical protein